MVLFDFWATWCGPCHLQARILHDVHEEWSARGVQFVGVDSGEPETAVRSFLAENPVPYPVLLDPEDDLSDRLGIIGLPTLMILDREGKVVYFDAGILAPKPLRELLEKAGAEPMPSSG